MNVRKPAVAGQFYPGTESEINTMLAKLVDEGAQKERVLGAMAPHAGWIYSGRGAGMLYSRIELPDTVVVLCPNHRSMGADISIQAKGSWLMPTGEVAIAEDFTERLMGRCDLVLEDPRAHAHEHSLEVQVPFIQHFNPGFRLVPISLGRVGPLECEELGKALAGTAKEYGKDVLVVASSDMTHFESAASAKKKDQLALEKLLALDPRGLYDVVRAKGITMCGVIPATIMLFYALDRGATKAELVDYRNSGDVTGDKSDVVAYASVLVK